MKRHELYQLIEGSRHSPSAVSNPDPHSPSAVSQQRDTITRDTDVITRAAALVPNSLNDESRSVTSTLTTEDPVPIYDWRTDRVVLEVLMVEGATYDDQTPLLRDHQQYRVDSILGSVTEVRNEGDELVGLVTFGDDLDASSEAIWKRVKQGHLRRVSVGYGYTSGDYQTVPAGRTQDVAGRSFTAPKDRDLRVVFRWQLREVSVVVIPADKRAQMRAAEGAGVQPLVAEHNTESHNTAAHNTAAHNTAEQTTSNPRQLGTAANAPSQSSARHTTQTSPTPTGLKTVDPIIEYLRGVGLPADITARDAALTWARQHLSHEHVEGLRSVASANSVTIDVSQYRQAPAATNPNPTQATTAPAVDPPVVASPAADPVAAERSRQTAIRSLAASFPQVPAVTVTRCFDEGLSLDQTREIFLAEISARSQAPVPPTAPAAHVRGGLTLETLQAGLMLREGIHPDSVALRSQQSAMVTGRREFRAGWLSGAGRTGEARDRVEAAFDAAERMRLQDGSLMRFCEAIVDLEGGQRTSWSDDETLERAFSSADFSAVFGAVVHMSVVAGYMETPATYQEFCQISDVADFRKHTESEVNGIGRLQKQGKPGGQAALLNPEDPTLAEYAAERYAGMLKISDQTIINDTFGITGQFPREIGISARQIPTDLVFSILLGNPNMSDGDPLFISANNMLVAPMTEAGLASASVLLRNKKIGNKRIVISESVLVHGTALEVAAKKLINNTTTNGGDQNVMRGLYRLVPDTAIDLGVSDPSKDPEVEIAGLPGSYFIFGQPKSPLRVVFRRGTNRGPITRTAVMDKGEFGVCWDVIMDCGAAATSRLGVVRCNIA